MVMKLRHTELSIPAGPIWLRANLAHAPDVRALVIVAQTAVGQHESSREAYFAAALQAQGFATLLLDLITRHEDERDPDVRFNTPLLATRIDAVLDWLDHQPPLTGLSRGLCANGTGSGAAVRAASRAEGRLHALFCRGGRLDLAGAGPLATLTQPVFVVAGRDDPGRDMIARAYALIRTEKKWQDIGHAGALFVEPGTLETVSKLAAQWLDATLPPPTPASAPPEDAPAT